MCHFQTILLISSLSADNTNAGLGSKDALRERGDLKNIVLFDEVMPAMYASERPAITGRLAVDHGKVAAVAEHHPDVRPAVDIHSEAAKEVVEIFAFGPAVPGFFGIVGRLFPVI